MAECKNLDRCTFINSQLGAMPAFAEMLRKRYCLDDCEHCVRCQLEHEGIEVPPDLFPDDEKTAKALIMKSRVPRAS